MKHCFRYMDDITIFGRTKDELHALRAEIDVYFRSELKLMLKQNWQVFPTYVRGLDFVGYRIFPNYTLLRKTTCVNFKNKMLAINEKVKDGQLMNYSDWCSVNSYKGWLKHCDSFRLQEKYIAPIQGAVDRYYEEVIKPKSKKGGTDMIDHGRVRSTVKPKPVEVDEFSVWENSDIKDIHEPGTEDMPGFDGYEYGLKQYEKNEYILMQSDQMTDTQIALCEVYELVAGV